jgi:antitoxin PrlF
MIESRFTPKSRTTLPAEVVRALDLRPGDRIAYRIAGGQVILSRGDVVEDPFATFTEWSEDNDRAAFAGF